MLSESQFLYIMSLYITQAELKDRHNLSSNNIEEDILSFEKMSSYFSMKNYEIILIIRPSLTYTNLILNIVQNMNFQGTINLVYIPKRTIIIQNLIERSEVN